MKPAGSRRGALQPNGYVSGSDGLVSICSQGNTGAGGDDTYSPHTKSSFPEKDWEDYTTDQNPCQGGIYHFGHHLDFSDGTKHLIAQPFRIMPLVIRAFIFIPCVFAFLLKKVSAKAGLFAMAGSFITVFFFLVKDKEQMESHFSRYFDTIAVLRTMIEDLHGENETIHYFGKKRR